MYHYNVISYSDFANNALINNIKERLSIKNSGFNFLGFKVHCLGRFSRKQRATSY